LIKVGRAEECADLLQNLRWLEAKNEAGLAFEVAKDFTDVFQALPATNSERLKELFMRLIRLGYNTT
jgi:hypothetical protein